MDGGVFILCDLLKVTSRKDGRVAHLLASLECGLLGLIEANLHLLHLLLQSLAETVVVLRVLLQRSKINYEHRI